MDIARLSSKGQITIPVAIRNKLGLLPGDKIFIIEEGGRFYLESSDSLAFKHVKSNSDESGFLVAETSERYCTIRESIDDSLREVRDMRDGNITEPTLDDLFENIKKWRQED